MLFFWSEKTFQLASRSLTLLFWSDLLLILMWEIFSVTTKMMNKLINTCYQFDKIAVLWITWIISNWRSWKTTFSLDTKTERKIRLDRPIRRRARSASKRYVLLIILHFVSRMNEVMCKCCQVYSSKFVLCLYSGCLCVAVY